MHPYGVNSGGGQQGEAPGTHATAGCQEGLTLSNIFSPETDGLPGAHPTHESDPRWITRKWLHLLDRDNRIGTHWQRGASRHDDGLTRAQRCTMGPPREPMTHHPENGSGIPGVLGPDGKTIKTHGVPGWIRELSNGRRCQEPAHAIGGGHHLVGKNCRGIEETVQHVLKRSQRGGMLWHW